MIPSLYEPLSRYRGQWVAVHTTQGACFHGVILSVTSHHLELREINDEKLRYTRFLRVDTIINFTPDARELEESKLDAMYYYPDDNEEREVTHV